MVRGPKLDDSRSAAQHESAVLLPSLVLTQLRALHRVRGFVLYAIFFIVYAVNCRQKSSWETASETYGLYLRAQSDASVRPFDEMSNFVDSGQWLLDLGLQIAPALDKVCTNCRLGLTAEATALSQLGLDRFVCSDFDSTVGSVCRSIHVPIVPPFMRGYVWRAQVTTTTRSATARRPTRHAPTTPPDHGPRNPG